MPSTDPVGQEALPIDNDAPSKSTSQPPTLPPNVSIFSPQDKLASKTLLEARIFTRLTVSEQTDPSQLAKALAASRDVNQGFCLSHGNVALVFDAEQQQQQQQQEEEEEEKVKDAHHEHVRAVCLALKDRDIGLDIAGCVFDASGALQAGFQFDRLSDGAVLVIDLMGNGDDDDDSSDEEANLGALLAGGEVVQ
ncbi:hypothetical protein M406DRAFT_69475 [Cryphonectria parasitica EP155]|uniref:Uncharacterized protein n=1 Tax=Cryphonectria parasitica (strain ATCC 38755 / EP155) TaxID=660469 RepID=A0A9P4Y6D4_CRYP1|nr:uncharacterized protein M406DRAFT_69475 [Cryphonectria parasitica EP155]KAF3767320.1 hypothetical protein M406DRAFT_69475 [Cryphonectria parasitica EP155]